MTELEIETWVRTVLEAELQRPPTDRELVRGLAVYAARLHERVSAGFERRPATPARPPKMPPKELA